MFGTGRTGAVTRPAMVRVWVSPISHLESTSLSLVSDERLDAVTPLSTEGGRLARFREINADLTARLECVCTGLSLDEFSGLVRQIAEVTVKYEAADEFRDAQTSAPPTRPR